MFNYDANSFDALGELESIRVNVPMYAGSAGIDGIKKLLGEVLENAKDEAAPCHELYLQGLRKKPDVKITVELLPDGSVIVEDDARGIPVDINEKTGVPAVYLAFQKKHAGGKLKSIRSSSYWGSIGVHGVGLTLVNACSKFVDVVIKRDGKVYHLRYEDGGSRRKDLEVIGECKEDETGTRIHFLYDDEVLKPVDDDLGVIDYPFIIEDVKQDIKDLVTFTDNLEVEFKWDTGDKTGDILEGVSQRGLRGERFYQKKDFSVESLIKKYTGDYEVISYFEENIGEKYKIKVYYSFADSFSDTIKLSVVNGLKMVFGSSFQKAFEDEVFKFFEAVMDNLNRLKEGYDLTKNEVVNKLNYIIILDTDVRDFANQSKSSYSNDRITMILRDTFKKVLGQVPVEEVNRVIESITFEYTEKIKQVEKYEKEQEKRLPRRNKRDIQAALSRKFKDCLNGRGLRHKNRVWFLEGDSAGNGFAVGRDARTEAYAMLRGKPLNVMRSSVVRIREGSRGKKERVDYEQFVMIRSIVDMNKFNSYIICTDADVDGMHIRNLISYIFFKFFPEIILKGQLYIAEAPLYKMKKGEDIEYAFYEADRVLLEEEGYEVTRRYKGLGEMEAGELYRVLTEYNRFVQVTLDDVRAPLDLDLGDLEGELGEVTPEDIVKYVGGKDSFLRREIVSEFMSEKLKRYLSREDKIRERFLTRVNPLYINDDGTSMTQDEIDMLEAERGKSWKGVSGGIETADVGGSSI